MRFNFHALQCRHDKMQFKFMRPPLDFHKLHQYYISQKVDYKLKYAHCPMWITISYLHYRITRTGRIVSEVEVVLIHNWEVVDHLGGAEQTQVEGDDGVGDGVEIRQRNNYQNKHQEDPVGCIDLGYGGSKQNEDGNLVQVELHEPPEGIIQVNNELSCLVESIAHVPIAGVKLWVGLPKSSTLDALHGGTASMDWSYLITIFTIVSIIFTCMGRCMYM